MLHLTLISSAILVSILMHLLNKKLLNFGERKILFVDIAIFITNMGLLYILNQEFQMCFYIFALIAMVNILYLISLIDIKYKIINTKALLMLFFVGLISMNFVPQVPFYNVILTSIIVAATLFFISLKSKNNVGNGDVKLIACISLFFGAPKILQILFVSLLLGLIFGMFVIFKYKKNLKEQLPFAPFLLVGTIIAMVLNF